MVPELGRLVQGRLANDSDYPETTDAGSIENLKGVPFVVFGIGDWP
jgi:hypothetical protein